ncbi:transcription factor 23 [Columba livia]|uniref:transcription factor 23 n=1 Tax=Columba livia TaxID=8932 RepID=UPI0031BA9118
MAESAGAGAGGGCRAGLAVHGCPPAVAAPGSRGRRGPCGPTRAPRRCRGVGAGSNPWPPSGKQGSPPSGQGPPGPPCPRNAARERGRVRALRRAFLSLQAALPAVPPGTRLSQLDVLVLATSYIAQLSHALGRGSPPPAPSCPPRRHPLLRPVEKWPMRSRLYTSPWGGPVSAPPRHSRQQPPAHRPGEQQAGSGGQPPLAPGVPTGAPTAQGHRAPGWTGAAARAGGSVPVGFAPQPRMAVPSSAGSRIPAPVPPWAQPWGQDPRDTGWAGAGEGVHTQHCSRGWGHPAPPAAINLQPPPPPPASAAPGLQDGPSDPHPVPCAGGGRGVGGPVPPSHGAAAPRPCSPGSPAGPPRRPHAMGKGPGPRLRPEISAAGGARAGTAGPWGTGPRPTGSWGTAGGLCGAGPGAPNTCAPEPFIGGQQTQRGVTRAGGRSAPGGWGGPWPGSGA